MGRALPHATHKKITDCTEHIASKLEPKVVKAGNNVLRKQSFLLRRSQGYQLATFSESATYVVLHICADYLGGSHEPLGRVESDKQLLLPELSW